MTPALEKFLSEYPLTLEYPLLWGDMDAFAHLNNTVYLRYFETARVAYTEQLMQFSRDGDSGPILADTYCRFRIPLTYPDRINVGVRVSEVRDYDFIQEYAIYSFQHDGIAATGTGRVVNFDYVTGEKVTLSATLRDRIAALEKERES